MGLRANNISKSFTRDAGTSPELAAVQKTSIDLPFGTLVEVRGHSGSGKSTLLNMMAGLLAPDAGAVELDGQDIYALDDKELSRLRHERFGVIPQTASVLSSFTVLDNVMLPLTFYGTDDARERAMAALEVVGIGHLAAEHPNVLSGGEVRRVSIARALVNEPDIVFADEPTSNLDEENARTVLGFLRKIADKGAAVLLVTHDDIADAYADITYHMTGGVLGEPEFGVLEE